MPLNKMYLESLHKLLDNHTEDKMYIHKGHSEYLFEKIIL